MITITAPRRSILLSVLATALCIAIAVITSVPAADTVASLPLALYLPGATLISAIDPHGRNVDGPQRFVLSVGASLGIVIIGGLVLNLTGGLTRYHWLIALASVVFISAVIGWVRGTAADAGGGGNPSSESGPIRKPDGSAPVRRARRGFSLRQGLLLFCAIGVASAAMVLSIHSNERSDREHFAQLWILTQPQNRPFSKKVQVGMENFEGGPRSFIVLETIGTTTKMHQVVLSQQVVSLREGQKWLHNLTRIAGQQVVVTVALSSNPNKILDTVSLANYDHVTNS